MRVCPACASGDLNSTSIRDRITWAPLHVAPSLQIPRAPHPRGMAFAEDRLCPSHLPERPAPAPCSVHGRPCLRKRARCCSAPRFRRPTGKRCAGFSSDWPRIGGGRNGRAPCKRQAVQEEE
ncbi:unnamed protein product, partial [Prorocentrum cordatum]